MINSVVLVGRLVRDPEMRYTQNGIAVTNFRIAVDRPVGRDEQGNKQTDFLDIVAWQKTAELCGQYLSKGAPVGIQGRIQTRSWTSQDGQQRYVVEVVADRVAFLESRAERERRESGGGSEPKGNTPLTSEASSSTLPDYDYIPPEPLDAGQDPFEDQ
ncbi:MAG: single-stranded DNA-binding protein [Candidatus Zipacnadales bacterium]